MQNAKVVQMGLGKYGAVQAAKGGGVLTIVLISVYRVIDYFLTDSATLNQLIGTLATDVVKVGLAIGALIAAVTFVASTGFVIAFGPLIAAIAFGVGVAMLLEYADEKFKITEKIILALDEISEKGINRIIEEKKQVVINKGNEITSNVIDSVIDYAVEKIEKSITNIIDGLLRNFSTPKFL